MIQKHIINEEYKSEVFLMDCMEGMKQYPDKYFDLACVDVPYGIDMDGGKISTGMQEEIKLAKELNIPIKAMSKETKILFKPK